MKTTCIMCPVGCELSIEKVGGQIKVSGNNCVRGERYGISEMTAPTRMITSLVKTDSGVASVKTTNLVPKEKIFNVLNELKNIKLHSVKKGEIIIKNVANLDGIDIVVTRQPINE